MEKIMICRECGKTVITSYEVTCSYSQDNYAYCQNCEGMVLVTPIQQGGVVYTNSSNTTRDLLYKTGVVSETGKEYVIEGTIPAYILNTVEKVLIQQPEFDTNELLQALWNLEHGKHFAAYADEPNSFPYIKVKDQESLDHDVALLRKLIQKLTK